MRHHRKRRPGPIPYIVLGFTVALCSAGAILPGADSQETTPETPAVLEAPAPVTIAPDLEPVGEEDPDEPQKIEAALLEQGYFREDVPLSFQEQDFLHTACEEFGVEYEVMLGLIEHETRFRNTTGDSCQSLGYCQIQPKWWSGLMEEIGATDLMEPFDNFRTGAAILSKLLGQYGDLRAALTAYNAGHDTGGRTYANAVLKAAEGWGWTPTS